MQKQLKRKKDNLERDKQNLAKKEEDLNKLIDAWEFFNSEDSKKYLNLPTFKELLDYEGRVFDDNDNISPNYKNLEYDLTYFNFILDVAGKYDFFVPCPLTTPTKIRLEDISDMKITETYINFIESIRDRLKEEFNTKMKFEL